jgi:hypothetical protein
MRTTLLAKSLHERLGLTTSRRSKKGRATLGMGLLAAISVIWLLARTGRKPSRITYPCQRAAVANVEVLFLTVVTPSLGFTGLHWAMPRLSLSRPAKAVLLLACLILALGSVTTGMQVTAPVQSAEMSQVPLDLRSQTAVSASASSSLFFVQNASGPSGNMDAAFSTLLSLMQNHSLYFYKTGGHTDGLIAKNDVILIKVNAVGPERAGTNTDLVKSLIKKILNHPDGFTGEIVVADNGQGTGGLNLAESNSYDHAQSFQDVVDSFGSQKVSAWSWYTVRSSNVGEYDEGDLNDGYVVNRTMNPRTLLNVSYPKFRTKYGTYISFKKGIWDEASSSYDSARLKIINFPILKSHYNYGVTACMKNYMGVQSQDLSNMHDVMKYGAAGTEMAETRFPTLNILDAIWINANPIEYGKPTSNPPGSCGPTTSYEAASYTNILGASTDPVALEYWSAKNILIPTAISKGYAQYSSLNPDYAPITQGLNQSYHNYLQKAANELTRAGYSVSMDETQINVYKAAPAPTTSAFTNGYESGSFSSWTGVTTTPGEAATVTNARPHHGSYSAVFASDGGGGYESAYAHKAVSSSELYARGYFYVSESGLAADGDRTYFIVFKAGSSNIAYAGWRRDAGTVKWWLTLRQGTDYIDVPATATSPSSGRWYCVELHWVEDASNGLAEMWVDGVLVCSSTGKDTGFFGSMSSVAIGLAEAKAGSTTLHVDCVKTAGTYVNPEPGPEASSLSISLSRNTTTRSLGVWIRGILAPVKSGSTVSIWFRVAGGSESWSILVDARTNSSSAYSYEWFPSTDANYELMANWAGDSTTLRAETGTVELNCHSEAVSISITSSSVSTTYGHSITVSGSITPGKPKSNVTISQRPSGSTGWTSIAVLRTDQKSEYSFGWTPPSVGSYQLKASWLDSQTTLSAESPSLTLDCSKASSTVSISTVPSSTELDVAINGTLRDQYDNPLRDETVFIYYTYGDKTSWALISSVKTDGSGSYLATWAPMATGYYVLRVEWPGNDTHRLSSSTTTLSSIPYKSQYVFTVESNSSISGMSFDDADSILSLSVSGPTDTWGYARLLVAQDLVKDVKNIKVSADGATEGFKATLSGDSYILALDYPDSVRRLSVDLGAAAPTMVSGEGGVSWHLYLAVVSIAVIGTAFLILWSRTGRGLLTRVSPIS